MARPCNATYHHGFAVYPHVLHMRSGLAKRSAAVITPLLPVGAGLGAAGTGVGETGVGETGAGHDPPELSAWHLVALSGNQ